MKKLISLIFFLGITACDPFDSGRYYSLLVSVTDHTKERYQVPVHIRKDEWDYAKSAMLVFDGNGFGAVSFSDSQTPTESFSVNVEVEGISRRVYIGENDKDGHVFFDLY